jgi:antitoxin HigA-1
MRHARFRRRSRGKLPPIHPGEILREEFMVPLGLTAYAIAKAVDVPRTRIERVADEASPITPETALLLGRYFGTSGEFWLNLQTRYDALVAKRALAGKLERIAPLRKASAA